MPLKWERGKKSPYACNHFAVLQVGPNTSKKQLEQTKQSALRELEAGGRRSCACGHPVDGHEVGHAMTRLTEPVSLAEELLLIHPQPPRDNMKKVMALVDNLAKAAELPMARGEIPLRAPASVLWFTPAPGRGAVEPPEWRDLGLGCPEADLELDIVFDR